VPGLGDVCYEMVQALTGIESECLNMLRSLAQFESYADSYVVKRLSDKLMILAHWILSVAQSLYEEHEGQGYVCIFLSEAKGITIHWVEEEEIVADKAWFEAGGFKVLSVDQAMDIISDMLQELASGNWAKVADWLKKYGKSSGLDFGRFLTD